jgi:hypothetical protein
MVDRFGWIKMKLREFRVREFQSVWDSGPITVGDVTCLVGKNEAGKTALLRALYRLNPIADVDVKFDVTYDYPKKEVANYEYDVDSRTRPPATVIEAQFELESEDANAIEEVLGTAALTSHDLYLSKNYSNEITYKIDIDEQQVRRHLAERLNTPDPLREQLSTAQNWKDFGAALDSAEATTEVAGLRELLGKFAGKDASQHVFDTILKARIPKFLYFDEYYQMKGHANIPALIQRKATKILEPSDYPLLGLISHARIKIEDLLNVKRTLELTNKLEGAGNHLSRQILPYWSQNKHL